MQLFLDHPGWLNPEIIPGLPFRWYGLMYVIAFVVAYLVFMRQVKLEKRNITSDEVLSLFIWCIVGLLAGARLFYCLIYQFDSTIQAPWNIVWPFNSNGLFVGYMGMSYHGGIIGVLVALIIYCKRRKVNLLEWGDLIACAVPLGYTFGRLGNFINGELYGRVTTAPWGMFFGNGTPVVSDGSSWENLGLTFGPDNKATLTQSWFTDMFGITTGNYQTVLGASHVSGVGNDTLINLPRHPSQLYEAFFEGIVIWAILWFIIRNRKQFSGYIMGWYLILYGVVRFFLEYLRAPDPQMGYPITLFPGDVINPQIFQSFLYFTTGQILCALMIVGGILVLYFGKKKAGEPVAATVSPDDSKTKPKRRLFGKKG